jgi:predicted esterase
MRLRVKRAVADAAAMALAIAVALALGGCHGSTRIARDSNVNPFNFQVAVGQDNYQIKGYIGLTTLPGRRPALLILNAANASAEHCIKENHDLTGMGMQVACVSIPGYGGSSGPGRFVGPQAVKAARAALDLLSARADVEPRRIAVWGLSEGAVAAGLLMDSDPNVRVIVLQSGAYDMLRLWPESSLGTKISILHQVWPSKRALKERSVLAHLPPRLNCSVLILHGERDKRTPVKQAERLAQALRVRGARVKTMYFPKGDHNLGRRVDPELRSFLRANLLEQPASAAS